MQRCASPVGTTSCAHSLASCRKGSSSLACLLVQGTWMLTVCLTCRHNPSGQVARAGPGQACCPSRPPAAAPAPAQACCRLRVGCQRLMLGMQDPAVNQSIHGQCCMQTAPCNSWGGSDGGSNAVPLARLAKLQPVLQEGVDELHGLVLQHSSTNSPSGASKIPAVGRGGGGRGQGQ